MDYALILLVLGSLLLRIGMTAFVVGLTRAKNAGDACVRSILDLAVALLAYFLVGAIFCSPIVETPGAESAEGLPSPALHAQADAARGHHPFLSVRFAHYRGRADVQTLTMLAYVLVASGIAVGPLAERANYRAVFPSAFLLAGLVTPLLAYWSNYGWLARWRVIDVAGAGWLHVAGGTFGLIVARFTGARQNKYHRDGSVSVIPGHNLPLATLGSLLATAGLLVLVSGGGSARAVINTLISIAAATVASVLTCQLKFGKADLLLTLASLIGGAVAMSAAGAAVIPLWAVPIGAAAGVIVPLTVTLIDVRLRVDDPSSLVAAHLGCGVWGLLAAGLFSGRGVAGSLRSVGVQMLAVTAAVLLASLAALAVVALFRGRLRVSDGDEFDGLDLAAHDVGAYPDFQQNTIRSYHLREA